MKTQFNPTPGPWTMRQESVDPAWHIITPAGGRIVANVHIENPMDEANARLIASAPELLAALQDCISGHIPYGSDSSTLRARISAINTIANAAIAKAIGQQEPEHIVRSTFGRE